MALCKYIDETIFVPIFFPIRFDKKFQDDRRYLSTFHFASRQQHINAGRHQRAQRITNLHY